MSQLRIALFGEPQITHGGQAISWRTRKALALLIYLVVEGGAHSREKLATLLWPESNPDAGRATLRSTLRYLREPLRHATDHTSLAPHLDVTREAIAFNFESDYALDLDVVEAAGQVRASGEGGVSGATRRWQEAVEAHRGAFLEGFSLPDAPSFDDWTSLQRERWHLRMGDVYDRLSQAQAEAGDTVAALETATRWVAFDPLQEAAYRRLMRLQAARGDRAAALQVYKKCQQILAQELDVAPAPETRALAQRLADSELPGAMTTEQGGPGTRAQDEAGPTAVESRLALPFVGRGAQHTRLVESFYQARNGEAQVAIVEGEAGIGKTRLIEEFLGWAEAQGARVLQGRAFETGGRLPYQPLVDALRPVAPEIEEQLSAPWLDPLGALLPELNREDARSRDLSVDETLGRSRLFEAVVRLGTALAGEAPLVLFVDDLQWADAATLDLAGYVARRWREAQASTLLLGAIRSETLHRLASSEALRDWLRAMQRDMRLVRLRLERLEPEAIGQFVGDVVDREAHEARDIETFGDWLYRETGGQPFYLTEMMEALLETEALVARRSESGAAKIAISPDVIRSVSEGELDARGGFIPPGVRDVVRNRLARLSSQAFDLLAAGAVLGQAFDFKTLCEVAGLSRAEGLAPLDSLLATRLLAESQHEERPYTFAHDKIRDVVYTEAGDARRQLFHERALEILQEGQARAAQLAHHAAKAGDQRAAFEFNLQAGEEMMGVFAVRDALQHLRQARRALDEQPGLASDVEPAQRRRLYERLGRAYELVNDWEAAQESYEAMLAYAREAGLPGVEVTALNRLATIRLLWKLDPEGATAILEEAMQVAEAQGDRRGLAETHWNRCLSGFYSFERAAALEHGERAIELAREIGDEELIAKSLNASGYAASGVNLWDKVQAYGEEAQQLYAALGNRALEVDSLLLVAFGRINVGRTAAGVADARQALSVSREIENQWGEANSLNHLAAGLLDLGQYGEAFEAAQQALALPQIQDAPQYMAAFTMRGLVYWACQDLEKALADHLQAEAHLQELGNPGLARVLSPHLCADYAALGRWDEALEQARVAMQTKDFAWYYAGFRYWTVVEALLRAGEEEAAAADVAQLEQQVGHSPRYRIVVARSKALLSRRQGDRAQTRAQLAAALEVARDLSLPGEQWPALLALAALAEEEGREEEAALLRQEADGILRSLAKSIDDDGLRQNLLGAGRSGDVER